MSQAKSITKGKSPGLTSNDDDFNSWQNTEVPGPDVSDKATVVNLAKMCSDAYVEAPRHPDWLNTSLGFNHSATFGWKTDGLRGHVFTDKMNETVIVAFKGTSIGQQHHSCKTHFLSPRLIRHRSA